MNVDPNKEVTVTVPAGALLVALGAMAKQPYDQVAQPITLLEQALAAALAPKPEVPEKP
jgi:hypothetical protein